MRKGQFVQKYDRYELRRMSRMIDDEKLYVIYDLRYDKMVYASVHIDQVMEYINKKNSRAHHKYKEVQA